MKLQPQEVHHTANLHSRASSWLADLAEKAGPAPPPRRAGVATAVFKQDDCGSFRTFQIGAIISGSSRFLVGKNGETTSL